MRPVTRILNQANEKHWTPSIVTKLILDASSKVYEVLSTSNSKSKDDERKRRVSRIQKLMNAKEGDVVRDV